MSEQQALIPMPSEQAIEVRPTTPMEMISTAVSQGANMDVIERLVALQKQILDREAERQFQDAMNRVQTALGPIQADLTNPQTRSKYASYAALDRRIRPLYTREGLSVSFDTGDTPTPDHVRILAAVSGFGHTKSYKLDMPNDGKGAKGGDVMTKTHATGAAMSYGMRYLLKMIFNIAVGEDDNDGNGATMGELSERLEWIENARNLPELQRIFIDAYKLAEASHDKNAQAAIMAAKDKKKAALR